MNNINVIYKNPKSESDTYKVVYISENSEKLFEKLEKAYFEVTNKKLKRNTQIAFATKEHLFYFCEELASILKVDEARLLSVTEFNKSLGTIEQSDQLRGLFEKYGQPIENIKTQSASKSFFRQIFQR